MVGSLRSLLPLLPVESPVSHFLSRALPRLRWATVAALLLIALLRPGDSSLPGWVLILIFGGYNLLVSLLQRQQPRLRSFAWVAMIDLPVAGVLYLLSAEPGGPLFILFLLAVDAAAASLPLRGTLIYTAVAAALATAVETMLPLWMGTPRDVRALLARLLMLVVVGVGMAIVIRRLNLEWKTARADRDEAERLLLLDQLRADFISTTSHDLRTPLTATMAGLGLLEASASARLHPDEQDLLRMARRNTQYLDVLIDDLLAFNQLEAGVLRLDCEALDLRAVVMEAVAAMHPLFQQKDQRLTVVLPEPLPHQGDRRRLEQVMINLLANAHHYTPTGARTTITGQLAGDEVHLTVRDTGPGIAVDELEPIFHRFHRLAQPFPMTTGGSGLGLAIARKLVQLHGGRIWAESQVGQGAAFHIALPQDTAGGPSCG